VARGPRHSEAISAALKKEIERTLLVPSVPSLSDNAFCLRYNAAQCLFNGVLFYAQQRSPEQGALEF
jgi:hypothetical protein